YSTADRRVTAPLYGVYNIAEIYRCYSQMGINDIEFIIDSEQHRKLSSFVMLDNFKADKKSVIDIATGVDYSKHCAFQYLWRAYTLNPTEELASFISKYLVQQLPLQHETPEDCLNHHLNRESDNNVYQTLLTKLQELKNRHEDELSKAVNVSHFDNQVEVDSFENLDSYIESHEFDTIVLLGKAGSGKTKYVLQPIAKSAHKNKRVVYLSYLIPLVQQFCEKTNAVPYNNAPLIAIENADALGVVVNSSYKDHIASFLLNCDVLIIDEFEKVISTVCTNSNDTMPREEVFQILSQAIMNTPKVVVADADTTDTTLRWLKKLGKKIQVIKATQNPYKNVNVTIADKHHAFKDIKNKFEKENVILFDTIKSLRLVMIELDLVDQSGQPCEKAALSNSVLVVTGANKGLPEQAAFLKSPSAESLKYNKILASPCLASGYSIESDYTDNVNVMSDLTLGVFELINFSKRFRTSTNITFYLTSVYIYDYRPAQINLKDSDCDQLNTEFENKRKLFNSNQPLSMHWALDQLGFNVRVLRTSSEALVEGNLKRNKLNGTDVKARITAILDAPFTTQAEVDRILLANQVGFQAQAMIKKFEIMRDYMLDDVTVEDIKFDMAFTNKELFEQIWAKRSSPSSHRTSKKHFELAKFLKSSVIHNPDYLGKDGALRLSRLQVMDITRKIHEQHKLFEGVISVKPEHQCTQSRATKLVKSLVLSLGYKWPKHGYSGNKNLVKIELDDRAIAYRKSYLLKLQPE
ncbi:hypothetical protein, partial [Vibrio paucivorans]